MSTQTCQPKPIMHGMGWLCMGWLYIYWEWIGRWSRCTCCGTKPYSGSGTAKFQYKQRIVQAKNIPMPSLWWRNGWLSSHSACLLILQAKYHIPNAAIDLQLLIYWSINQVHVCLLYFVPDFHLWYANLMPCFLHTWWESTRDEKIIQYYYELQQISGIQISGMQ